eukprot:1176327-Prorocentrum_minimum.AAC.3
MGAGKRFSRLLMKLGLKKFKGVLRARESDRRTGTWQSYAGPSHFAKSLDEPQQLCNAAHECLVNLSRVHHTLYLRGTIIVVGLQNSGKSTIVNFLKDDANKHRFSLRGKGNIVRHVAKVLSNTCRPNCYCENSYHELSGICKSAVKVGRVVNTVLCTSHSLQVEEITPTVGFSVEQVKLEKCKLTIVDLSGDKRYHKLWSCYYEEAQAIIFVIDAVDRDSLGEAKGCLMEVVSHEHLQVAPITHT